MKLALESLISITSIKDIAPAEEIGPLPAGVCEVVEINEFLENLASRPFYGFTSDDVTMRLILTIQMTITEDIKLNENPFISKLLGFMESVYDERTF